MVQQQKFNKFRQHRQQAGWTAFPSLGLCKASPFIAQTKCQKVSRC